MQRFCLTLLLILACATAVPAASLYDQPPFNEKELQRFIADFPDFRAWCKAQRIQPRPLVDASGKADLAYTPETGAYLEGEGWEPERFLCLFGRVAAGVAMIRNERNDTDPKPLDMPGVSDDELDLVRRHLPELLALPHPQLPQK
ncbi:hypothetical protein [uncultured Bilophila sp.]|uniref:hypothetical protein n=1 Tax=uncultured Bilophila sp. TaxID=529385 RepID=UPI00262B15CE|nr:hypothetical protein [uncultured Bilophila sp.]